MAWPFRKKNPIANTSSKTHRVAVIDIGSNSIRLVVYDGPRRVPALIFNEKVMAGLGSKLDETGAIGDESMAVGMKALARFRQLCMISSPSIPISVTFAAGVCFKALNWWQTAKQKHRLIRHLASLRKSSQPLSRPD